MPSSPQGGPIEWLAPYEVDAWLGLLAIVQRAFPEIARQLRDDHDMLPVHYHILVALDDAPGRALQLSELARSAGLSQSRLTHRLRTLIDRGDVEVAPDPEDGRSKKATLTSTGHTRLVESTPSHAETVRRVIFDHLTQEQAQQLGDALAPVAASLDQHPEYVDPSNERRRPR